MRTKNVISKFAVAITMLILLTVSCSKDDEIDKCIFIRTNAMGMIMGGDNLSEEFLASLIFIISPNPAHDLTSLYFKTEGLNVVTITNKKGITLYKESFDIPEGSGETYIDISEYPVGDYRVTVTNGTKKSTLCLRKN
ncbi:MAG: T9SS type A sorting domain-containing protein [Firmicutes bacterium]|nr:T9SS type A sorting domain-containing protein [Bacillota bacterium]